MTAGGTWTLKLKLDPSGAQNAGGKTTPKQYGEIASVNVWNRVLRAHELQGIMAGCASMYKGNVKSWNEFKSATKANVKLVKSTCCKK